ncbi:MAG: hypothetical protein GX372_04115 [Ignavibacteria bacterium]|jgi:glucan phosphoethanolaminetransferase (alkaline phosphatase superfamily)|nr:hypothetical protein [Ignavibacteria bacterium]
MKRLTEDDIEKLKTKPGQRKYLFQQTKNWWLLLFGVYLLLNIINIPKEKTFIEHFENLFSISNILVILIFCLVLAFVYALIKLVHIKNKLKAEEENYTS